ncbi:carboxypeptidase-like regulatory domain-containing protein [Hymenobacter metallicola]|uniref:Carboxypeptidase-like regulatory domain-containing protein n=1 Tax=Hymenobacter metallicola TaxID=2563114 RepID=A0A4Z0QG60_9BACT|nr:carboxypeptidase-like regulatory domain-containing protein [Hymenobacter metallicola]TGE28725.1 carboxypeptidase-like regulatory domain-containing protein [Hymenobacter metallicola]
MPTFRYLLLLLLLSYCYHAPAQTSTTGQVSTAAGAPVPYASVGVQGKAVGTVADAGGAFALATLGSAAPTDTVVVSCVGYQARKLRLAELRQRPVVVLALVPAPLREVQVRHAKVTPGTLGRTKTGGTAHWSTSIRDISEADGNRGWEVATLLPIRKSCYLDSFHVYIEKNEFELIRLRFNLYSIERGQPTQQLLTQDVQFTIPANQTGWIDVDLTPYHLHLAKGQRVAAGIQWLQGQQSAPTSRQFGGPGAFPAPRHRSLVRDKSEASWRAYPIHVSMYLDVQTYK